MDDRTQITDQELASVLQNCMDPYPPDEITHSVTPFRQALNRVLIGFALCAITLDFWNLNYLLPLVGVFLALLGFRTLRRENKWFRACWILSVLRSIYCLTPIVLNATVYRSLLDLAKLKITIALTAILLHFCFWLALRTVKEKAGMEPQAKNAAALLVWNGFLCIWALGQFRTPLLVGILLVVAYIFIFRSLWKLTRELDKTGYCICAAPVKLTDKALTLVLTAVLLAGIACGYLFFHRLPMNWQAATQTESQEVQEVKEHLISLGFPEQIADDLTDEDLLSCKGALRVVIELTDYSIDGGYRYIELGEDGMRYSEISPDQFDLRITGIGVALPNERGHWRIFHHFQWFTDPGSYGTEAFCLWPANPGASNAWQPVGDFTGQLLYNDDGKVYTSEYYFIGRASYTATDSIFGWDTKLTTNVFVEFSLPKNGENHRGYVCYTTEPILPGGILDSWFHYCHQESWFQYPVRTSKEHLMSRLLSSSAFGVFEHQLLFYPAGLTTP